MNIQLFGVLNYTPDSFFDGGKNFQTAKALDAAQKLLDNGASFIDVGAEATNPFVTPITAAQEIERLKHILPELLKIFPNQISLDTYHLETLEWAMQFGTPILNDVSGLHNPRMIELAANHGLTCIIGHLPPEADGSPTAAHNFKIDDFDLVTKQLLERVKKLIENGIKKENIILDPNVGFGKTMRLNWQLLEFAKAAPDYRVMIGHSNKRFLGCDKTTGELLEDGQELRYTTERNIEAAKITADSGAAYLRVHDPAIYKSL